MKRERAFLDGSIGCKFKSWWKISQLKYKCSKKEMKEIWWLRWRRGKFNIADNVWTEASILNRINIDARVRRGKVRWSLWSCRKTMKV
jgi:hypothetical protein